MAEDFYSKYKSVFTTADYQLPFDQQLKKLHGITSSGHQPKPRNPSPGQQQKFSLNNSGPHNDFPILSPPYHHQKPMTSYQRSFEHSEKFGTDPYESDTHDFQVNQQRARNSNIFSQMTASNMRSSNPYMDGIFLFLPIRENYGEKSPSRGRGWGKVNVWQ
jgi:hypothetical protein